jgi:hypothetical protein
MGGPEVYEIPKQVALPTRFFSRAPHALLLSRLHAAPGPAPRCASTRRLALGPRGAAVPLTPRSCTEKKAGLGMGTGAGPQD